MPIILKILTRISKLIAEEPGLMWPQYSMQGRPVDLQGCKIDYTEKNCLARHSEPTLITTDLAMDPIYFISAENFSQKRAKTPSSESQRQSC